MGTLLHGVNHVAILTADMDRFIRFYQEAFEATVVHDNPNHAGNPGERMVIMSLGGQSEFSQVLLKLHDRAPTGVRRWEPQSWGIVR